MLRLSILYEDCNNAVSEPQSESWYLTKVWIVLFDLIISGNRWLDFQPGEVSSSATALRKNSDRDLGTRYAFGSKIDGLFRCKKKKFDICAVEAGPKDQGSTGTKMLKDGRKLAKVLKDMFDYICSLCLDPGNMRTQLRVYGILISGQRVEFVSLRERMDSMVKIVYSHIHPDADACLRELLGFSRPVAPSINYARTLLTPKSPKRRRPDTE
ncbi:hypothetical protein BGZ49_005571 [Haplosporangium sp. Z 27]|nr:hypothetical protein BGZ49_005571 [Haplosporangium sp. Z 27]